MTETLRRWSALSEAERAEAIEKARAFIADKPLDTIVWGQVARHCGLERRCGLRLALDPAYRERRQAEGKAYRLKNDGYGKRFSATQALKGDGRSTRVAPEDFAARLAEIPPDTRTLSQRIMGDPLPGRSALARRMESRQ